MTDAYCISRTNPSTVLSLPPSTGSADWAGTPGLSLSGGEFLRRAGSILGSLAVALALALGLAVALAGMILG
jgi:hypothetical protein